MMSITPTIGRKVWYWPVNEPALCVIDPKVPFDATVVYPWGETCVNLRVTDHAGNTTTKSSVFLHQGEIDDRPPSSCATWMPYQMGQAKAFAPRSPT